MNAACLPPPPPRTRVRAQVPVVEPSLFAILGCLPNRRNGGCGLVGLSKRAKKHSIAADCGEVRTTFGPRLRGTAEQQVKH